MGAAAADDEILALLNGRKPIKFRLSSHLVNDRVSQVRCQLQRFVPA